MDRVLGIIAEYNPFHNGHLYHLNESKAVGKADTVVAVMSGDFVQRGEPALMDKWTRANMAVRQGIDLVLELPFAYACNNAEYFALGAVRALDGLRVVDCLSFGSECGDLERLFAAARVLAADGAALNTRIREGMAEGFSYPKARRLAVASVCGDEIADVLASPNDILGTEYLKQLILLKSSIIPVIVKRHAADPFSENEAAGVAGAAAIRRILRADGIDRAARYLPREVRASVAAYTADGGRLLDLDDLRIPLICAVLAGASARDGGRGPADVFSAAEGLENRLIRAVRRGRDMDEIVRFTKTKRYTETRIKRLIVHTVMGLMKEDMRVIEGGGLYARVLAFSDRGAGLIRRVKKTPRSIPLITNPNRERAARSGCTRLVDFDVKAADMRKLISDGALAGFFDLNIYPTHDPRA
ncbi:MAG: nucleotidyltransferase family protein, partial [Clostridiales Family XIII bacterium]|nr:nucleotidyltransferase family protein [Clostridiales Family XIII bacterium]